MIRLEGIQKQRADRLETQLAQAVTEVDLDSAKKIIIDLRDIYTRFKQTSKYGLARIKLYEIAIEKNELVFAERGLMEFRIVISNRTRLHLEATALLAVCYLRMSDIVKAQPLIKEVLTNDKVIKSENKRSKFYKSIIDRFDEETSLYAIRGSLLDEIKVEEIEKEAMKISYKTEEELFDAIGASVPEGAKNLLFKVDQYSKNLLPSAERLKLPSSSQIIENNKVGKTIFSSARRVLYRSLCDPKSDIYKTWFNKGFGIVLNKAYFVSAITQAFLKIGIGITAIIIPVVALVIKFGIEVYCEKYKPADLIDLR